MTRGVLTVVLVIAITTIVLFVASVSVEPVGQHVQDNFDTSDVNGSSTIDEVYESVFQWTPLVFVGGFIVWAVRWYIRREATRGPR